MSTDERSQQLILLNEISGSLKSDGALRIRATVVGNMSEEPTACLAR
jgi:cytoskeletal protein CcmA (bactofilin family)